MKVLMVAPYPYPGKPIRGGVETVTYNLVEGFKECDDIDLKIISICQDKDEVIDIYPNVSVSFKKSKYPSRKVELKKHIKPLVLNINEKWNPDIIHLQGNGSLFLLTDMRLNHKMVVTQHGILNKEIKQVQQLRPKLNMLIAYLIECSKRSTIKNWVFISKYNLNFQSHFVKSKQINYQNIYNPVNPKYFISSESNENQELVNLIYVGRIIPRKGLNDLLMAMGKANAQCKLHVVGGFEDDDYNNTINNLIDQYHLSDNVIFHGWKTSDEIIEIYKEADALVLPSYQETLPCVIAEAMAMGKFVIATNIGGIPEMVTENETGYLYEAGDVESLASILKTVQNMSSETQKRISANAKEFAHSNYNPKLIAQAHINFYNLIIDNEKANSK